jgi:hypothetical protein
MTTGKVYEAIAKVMLAMGKEGIAKDRKNQQQGYQFRGIDDVYNALSGQLSENKLCMLPTVLERECEERQSAKGGALFYVTVKVRFDLVSAEDGSKHEITTYGEAMDSGDKATNKAMSAAYKYAAMQAFCIPTEGDNDADGQTHEVAGKQRVAKSSGDATAVDLAIEEQMRSAESVPKLVEIMNGLSKEQKSAVNSTFNQRMKELKKAA